MKDNQKTKEQLIQELAKLHQRVAELEVTDTERKRTEETLRRREQQIRMIADNVPALFSHVDADGHYRFVNKRYEEWFGVPRTEIIGKHYREVLGEATYELIKDRAEAALSGHQVCYEEALPYRHGGTRWVIADYVPDADAQGKAKGFFALVTDITERKQAEEALRESEEKYRSLVENSIDGIAIVQGPEIRFVNQALLEIFGYQSEDEMVGHTFTDFISPEFRNLMAERARAREKGEDTPSRYEFTALRKGGTEFDAELAVSTIGYEGSMARQGVIRDITERKRAERLLRALNRAALAMEQALTHEDIFAAAVEEFKRLDFYCAVFLTDESQGKLFPKHLSYEDGVLKAAEKLTGLNRGDFPISIEDVDVFRKIVWERETVFVDAEEVIWQVLPKRAKRFTRQIVSMLKIPKSIEAPLIVEDQVIGVLSVQSEDLTEDDVPAITAFAHQMAAAWRKARLLQDLERSLTERRRAHEELQRSFQELRRTFEGTVNVLVSTTEMRDPYTAGHQRRVTQLAWTIAKEMGLPEEQIEGIRMAGLIHDLGKISVPAEILNKPGPLTELEYGLIKMHPQTGHDVLKTIDFPWPVAQIVLQHHERIDSSGYPTGLSGEEILLEARILSVADVVEAMASHRPYRSARGMDEALQEISQNRGILYDPKVVDTCLKLFTVNGFTFE